MLKPQPGGATSTIWIRPSDGSIDVKVGGNWEFRGTIKGDKGDTGGLGPEGPAGPAGEVTTQQMNDAIGAAIGRTSNYTNAVALIDTSGISDPVSLMLAEKYNEMFLAQRRYGQLHYKTLTPIENSREKRIAVCRWPDYRAAIGHFRLRTSTKLGAWRWFSRGYHRRSVSIFQLWVLPVHSGEHRQHISVDRSFHRTRQRTGMLSRMPWGPCARR